MIPNGFLEDNTNTRMHELFAQVLTKRDLSKAGDLFLLEDQSISDDLSKVLNKIQEITSASEFIHSDNDQSVVEISITRVTSAIRDTGTIDQHATALVSLLESCLNHDLRPSPKDEDPPHAKITSDLVSCIFMNHNKKAVMKLALPIAVKFLHRGNKELSRNLSSYLSLAAINNADLLSPHIQPIIDSIIGGNYSLARVLPQIYVVKKEPIHDHVMALVSLLPQCENQEKLSLLSLFALIAKRKPILLESNLPQLSECLTIPSTSPTTLQIFLDMAFVRPVLFTEHIQKIKAAAELQSGSLTLAAKLLGVIGKLSLDRGRECLDFLVAQLGKTDHTAIHGILREIRSITDTYPSLLSQVLPHITAHLESSSSCTARMYLQQLKADLSTSRPLHTVNHTPGGVTIVKVGGSKHDMTLIGNTLLPVTTTLSQPTNTNSHGRSIIVSKENRISYPDSRSLTQLGSLQAMNHSSGRLHNSGSMSSHQSTSCLGHPIGLHTSMTRLVPSVINRSMTAINSRQNLASVPFAKISSGGVTVTTATSISSHKSITGSTPTLQEMQASVVMVSINSSTQTAESSSPPPSLQPSYSVSVASAMPLSPASATSAQEITMSSNSPSMACLNNAPSPAPKLRNNSTRITMNSTDGMSVNTQRISVFEPYPMRDAIQHFCEKHLDKIKSYMEKVFARIPLPAKCTIEERKAKKHAKLHFACQGKGEHCLYSKHLFLMKTRNPRIWIHLMFLALQARASSALSTREASVSSLKNCWDTLKADARTFLTLVTSAFPSAKDQDLLIAELRNAGFLAMFEYNAPLSVWGCFLCNHPDRAQGFLQEGAPVIEGQLKEKKGKWKLFRRWRTRYFTLSGAHLSYRGVKDDKDIQPIDVSQIQSVRAIGSRGRNIPKAFEIFTHDKTFVLKAKDGKNTEQWVQYLSVAMAHSHAKEVVVH